MIDQQALAARKGKRDSVKALHPDSLSFKLALLKVGEVLLQETTRKLFNRLRDRVTSSMQTKALHNAQFKCSFLICHDLQDPSLESYIARIERLPNLETE